MIEKGKKFSYPMIDVMKFIMALTVALGHAELTANISNVRVSNFVQIFSSVNNAYFFLASGFLLFLSLPGRLTSEETIGTLRKRALQILKLHLVWILIYLPFELFDAGGSAIERIKYVVLAFLCRGGINYSQPFWFLYSMWLSFFLFYLILIVVRKIEKSIKKEIPDLAIGLILLAISILLFAFSYWVEAFFEALKWYTGPYSDVCQTIKYYVLSGRLFQGPIYICVGIFFGKGWVPLKKWMSWVLLLLFSAWIIMGIFPDPALYPYKIVHAIALFDLTRRVTSTPPGKQIFPFLRKSSVVMYYTHFLLFSRLLIIFSKILPKEDQMNASGIVMLILVMALSLVVWKYRKSRLSKFLFN